MLEKQRIVCVTTNSVEQHAQLRLQLTSVPMSIAVLSEPVCHRLDYANAPICTQDLDAKLLQPTLAINTETSVAYTVNVSWMQPEPLPVVHVLMTTLDRSVKSRL
jgi:hypothetical protein